VKPEPIEQYISAVGPKIAWVAQAGNCTNTGQLWVTEDQGVTWSRNRLPGRVMRVRPTSATQVHTSRDRAVRPCGTRKVIDLTALDGQRAWVLCANGEVRATTDGGQQWSKSYTHKNALAFSMAEGGDGVLVTTDPECEGVVVKPISAGVLAPDGACVEGPVTPQRVSVSNAGATSWWLLNGARAYWSDDPGGPWNKTRIDPVG
jgi:hypothetical protein